MSRVEIPPDLVTVVDQHALRTYPEECCGILIGSRPDEDPDAVHVTKVIPAPNEHSGPRDRRFEISPEKLLRAYQRARRQGEEIVGYYHSHPDRDSLPSPTDLAAAAPGVSYLIVAVSRNDVAGRRCWRLGPEGDRFQEEELG
jgi:proteasome lid subunit RPN8/RPN11